MKPGVQIDDRPIAQGSGGSDRHWMRRYLSSGGAQTLPGELVAGGVRRLRILAASNLAVLALLGIMGLFLQNSGELLEHDVTLGWIAVGGSVLLAIAMIVYTYAPNTPAERVLGWGTVFQVATALCLGFVDFVRPWSSAALPHGIPFLAMWVMAFPLVPTSLRRGARTAFGAAAMGPLAWVIAGALGASVPTDSAAFVFYMPLLCAAILSTIASSVIHGLAVDVSQARHLGSYQLVERIAAGGMGEVWRARHGSLIRPAAIKLISAPLLSHGGEENALVLARFEREAQATAMLESPHTVVLYDFGRTGDGVLYYVMELLGGIDLEELVRTHGPLPAERVIAILRQICDSLGEAHSRGLVHRDVKPANLRLTIYAGQYDFVKVLDFGLAKPFGGVVGTNTLATADNMIAGTPAYVAPEQATGATEVDGRADLYALGCVAYWLLTGRLVFEAKTTLDMLFAHAKETPLAPSHRTELPVPPALDALVLQLLAKAPDDRPANAAAVADRLDAIAVSPTWTRDRAERWWRTHFPAELERASGPRSEVCELPAPEMAPICAARSRVPRAPQTMPGARILPVGPGRLGPELPTATRSPSLRPRR